MNVKVKIISEVANVMKRLDQAERYALGKTGAYLRRQVRQSIIRSVRSSVAPEPPRTHGTGKFTLKNVFFDVEMRSKSTAIGYKSDELDSIAFLHENGGMKRMPDNPPRYRINDIALVPDFEVAGSFRRKYPVVILNPNSNAVRKRVKNKLERRAARLFYIARLAGRTFNYPKREFLQPAIQKESVRALEIWRDSL